MTWTFAWKAIFQYKLVIAVLVVAGVTGGIAFGAIAPPRYHATSQLMLEMSPEHGSSRSTSDPASGNEYLRAQMPTYLEYAKSKQVLDAVAKETDLSVTPASLKDDLEFTVPSDTVVVEITATWGSAKGAATIANLTASSFATRIPRLANGQHTSSVVAKVFSPATAPGRPSHNVPLRLGLGAFAGGLIGVLLAWTLKLRDPFARRTCDLVQAGGRNALGLLPSQNRRATRGMLRLLDKNRVPKLPTSYDGIFAQAGLADSDQGTRIITVARSESHVASEELAWGLACVAANSGLRTLIATGDVRIHRYFSSRLTTMSNQSGAPDLLSHETIAPPPGGVSSTPALTMALSHAASSHDLVLIAARSPLDDPNVTAQVDVAHGIVLATPPKTHHGAFRTICERLRQSGANLIGFVITDETGVPPTDQPNCASAPARRRSLQKSETI